jgi:hypothetical protein
MLNIMTFRALLPLPLLCAATAVRSNPYQCERPLDIVFCVDASGSVNPTQWGFTLAFVRDVAAAFDFGPQRTQMGLVQFSTTVMASIPLNAFTNGTLFGAQALATVQAVGSTNTWLGLEASAAQIVSFGRLPENGAAHVIIVVTDGQSSTPARVATAAAAAWDAGSTLALITIGPNVNPIERQSITRGNSALDFPLEDWSGIEDDDGLLSNITQLVCRSAIVPDDLLPINTTLPCNSSVLAVYYPNVTSPLNLLANVTTGSISLCFSYTVEDPTPEAAATNPATVRCSFLQAGNADVATATAFPTNSTPGSASETLFIAVTTGEAPDGSCGGQFVLAPYYCSVRLALNVSAVQGDGVNVTVNTTWLGDPAAPRCSECPLGTSRLSADPASPLWDICANSCLGRAQFTTLDATGVETCGDCDGTCSACGAPGGSRQCRACPDASPGGLLANGLDPALRSPFWDHYGAVPVREEDGGEGRCLGTCPAGYTGIPAPGSGYGEFACTGSTSAFAALTWTTAATLCLPRGGYPDVNGTGCVSLQGSPLVAELAASLAVSYGVPLPAVFLRSCIDLPLTGTPSINGTARQGSGIPAGAVDEGTRWSWGFADPISPISTPASWPYFSIAETPLLACNCSTLLTFALVLGVAAPGDALTPASRAAGMTALSVNDTVLLGRNAAALTLLNASLSAPPYALTCADSRAGGWTLPVLLAACADANSATAVLNASTLSGRNSASLCGPAVSPPPLPGPAGASAVGAVVPVGATVAGTLFLLLLLLLTVLYARFRSRRLELVASHEAKVKRLETSRIARALGAGLEASRPTVTSLVGGNNPAAGLASSLPRLAAPAVDRRRRDRLGFSPTGASFRGAEAAVGPTIAEAEEQEEEVEAGPPPEGVVVNPLAAALSLPGHNEVSLEVAPEAVYGSEGGEGAAGGGEWQAPTAEGPLPARAPITSLAGALLEFLVPGAVTWPALADGGPSAPVGPRMLDSAAAARRARMEGAAKQYAPFVPASLALPDTLRTQRVVERVETVALRPVSWTRGREGVDLGAVRTAGVTRQFSVISRSTIVEERARVPAPNP